MVEQPHARKGHNDPVLIAGINHKIVPDGAARLCNIGNTAPICPLNIIPEGEESIGAEGNPADRIQISAGLRCGQRFGAGKEILLPVALCSNIFLVFVDVAVDHIVPVGS